MSLRAAPTLSVIVPATDRPPSLGRCTRAIEAGLAATDELIVVTEPARAGPAEARNVGARRAAGDLLVFADADVILHPDALDRIRTAFASDASLSALFGSYDDHPEAPGAVSGFRNLLHHHVHHSAAGPAATFWTGLGAIRREAFEAAGGFDAERFEVPSMEDVELGMRLARNGARIVLDPGIQGTHLKRWSVVEMARTDLLQRGIPWVRLLRRPGVPRDVLNLGWRHRLSAAATLAGLAAIAARRLRVAALAALALVLLNRSLYALLWRRRGPREAVAGVGLHALHHLTGIVAVPAGVIVDARSCSEWPVSPGTTRGGAAGVEGGSAGDGLRAVEADDRPDLAA